MALFVGVIFVLSNDYLSQRLVYIFTGQDGSASARVLEGFKFLEYTPFFGVGLGNNSNYIAKIFEAHGGVITNELYNNIILAIVTTGYIGAVFFILYQGRVFKKNKGLFWLLMLTHFAWGKLWAAPMWIFILLYKVISKKDELDRAELEEKRYVLK